MLFRSAKTKAEIKAALLGPRSPDYSYVDSITKTNLSGNKKKAPAPKLSAKKILEEEEKDDYIGFVDGAFQPCTDQTMG